MKILITEFMDVEYVELLKANLMLRKIMISQLIILN